MDDCMIPDMCSQAIMMNLSLSKPNSRESRFTTPGTTSQNLLFFRSGSAGIDFSGTEYDSSLHVFQKS
jgi:hypothetical protein